MAEVSRATGLPLSFLLIQSLGAPDLWRRQLELVAQANATARTLDARRSPGARRHADRPRPSYHPSCAGRRSAALDGRCRSTELLAELRKPDVKARDPRRDRPADRPAAAVRVADRARAVPVRPHLRARRPARLRADRRRVDRRHRRGARAATRGRCSTTAARARRRLLLGAVHQLRRGVADAPARDDRPPRHRDRPVRRRRPRADDLRRLDARRTCSPTGPATAPRASGCRWSSWSRKQTARHRRGCRPRTTGARSRPGKQADLNVIDLDRLQLHPPRSVDDLPAGGRRILQDATGYVATIVSGVVTRRDGSDTGARPGRLVRVGVTEPPPAPRTQGRSTSTSSGV